eukprot:CAMPEP_0173176092 /NCGR_PEP_ID=MMETSP1141-20130122/4264_1 /TAXON_ID=483371 /ORGANISM="non described non described, Strain CCMP2298" /LENGTH=67 /DNA_ID=CAMNT_0014098385 /DNA_START=448 /DNA_END=651 /DNA_ORIENTATION=+
METLEVGAEPSQQAQVPILQHGVSLRRNFEPLQILAFAQYAPQRNTAAQGVVWFGGCFTPAVLDAAE